MKKHGDIYQYEIYKENGNEWFYEIHHQHSNELIRSSNEWFDSEAQAGFAAVGHISLLENGEG